MALGDAQVQIAPDSSGAQIDVSQVTRPDGTVVDRQRFVQASNVDVGDGGIAGVQDGMAQVADRPLRELLASLLVEMRVQSTLLAIGLNVRDDVDAIRRAISDDLSTVINS